MAPSADAKQTPGIQAGLARRVLRASKQQRKPCIEKGSELEEGDGSSRRPGPFAFRSLPRCRAATVEEKGRAKEKAQTPRQTPRQRAAQPCLAQNLIMTSKLQYATGS